MKNRKALILLFSVLFLSLLLVGCLPSGTTPTPEPENELPIITSTPITTATVGFVYSYDVQATDPDGDTLTYTLSVAPSGMNIDYTTGIISWSPSSLQLKDNGVVVRVSDGTSSVTQSFIITVNLIGRLLESIEVLPETMELSVAQSLPITSVTATYDDEETAVVALADCTYVSDAPGIASVATNGVITGVAAGTATITVSYTEGAVTETDTVVVTVIPRVLESITVLPATMELSVTQSLPITSITANYNYGTAIIALTDCAYVSDDPSIASVAAGVITGESVGGPATITVSYTEGAVTETDTVVVTVIPRVLESITVLPATMELSVTQSLPITSITANYNYGTAIIALTDCAYVSDDPSIASVAAGVITGESVGGPATITVSYTEGAVTETDTVVVTVIPRVLESITVLPATMELSVTQSLPITSITANYNYGTAIIALTDCAYVSDDPSIASVAAGVITGESVGGPATITVSYTEGAVTETDTVVVTVIPRVLESITVLPATMELSVTQSLPITSITANYNYGTAIIALTDCAYVSDDPSIASVAAGVITGESVGGPVTITVSYTEGAVTETDTVVVTVVLPANLELTPPSQTVTQGSQATIDVVVEGVTDLLGASITLNFEAAKLQYVSSAAGSFFSSAALFPTADNVNGLVTFAIATLAEKPSGTGTIITVVFNTIASGSTNITFGATSLRDKNNVSIFHTKGSGCSVTID